MKKKKRIFIFLCCLVLGMNVFSFSKQKEDKFEVFTKITKPVLALEKSEMLQKEINEKTFPIEYDFWINNYEENGINGIEMEYSLAIDCSTTNFPISYQLIDGDKGEEIPLTEGKTQNFNLKKEEKQRKPFKLILNWRELDDELAEELLIRIKVEVEQPMVEKIEEEIIKLTRDSSFPVCKVTYSVQEMTNENVMVTLNCNKEVEQVSGFKLLEDRKTLTKELTENKGEKVRIRDLSGNEIEVEYQVNWIDKQVPQIIGCENGGIYEGPLKLEFYDNQQIQEIKIDRYESHLFVTAYEKDANLVVCVEAHPLDTRKYRYYVNDKFYSIVTEPIYEITNLAFLQENKIKIEALDEEGNILDTVLLEEIGNLPKENRIQNSESELIEPGNYQIKVSDLAGNETIYHIKIK